jgi:PAS domain-containing protein
MANKTISLKTNIYFNALLFALYFVIILLFSYFFIQQFQKTDERKELVQLVSSPVEEAEKIKNQVFTEYQLNSGLTSSKANEFNDKLKNTEQDFYYAFHHFTGKKYSKKNPDLLKSCDSLKTSFQLQVKRISLLISALQQRGTKSSGVIESALQSGSKLVSIANRNDSKNVSLVAQELIVLQQQQAYEKNPVYKNLIQKKADQVKNEFRKAGIYDQAYLNEIDNILSGSITIYNLDAVIGNYNSGLLGGITESYRKSSLLSFNISNTIDKTVATNKFKFRLSFILSLLVFFTALILFYLKGSITYVVKPVEKFIDALGNMVKGRLLAYELDITTNNSLTIIGEDINKINKGLLQKTEFARKLNQGEINQTLNLLSDEDVLGTELISLQKNLQASAEERKIYDEESEKRRYINEGLAKFSEITHAGYDKIEKLTDNFIRELVKYLNCLQGGIFLTDEETNSVLNLTSAFAYNRKKYITKQIPVGEGLVGTCAVEKKTIHLSEIPDDYMLITSGLGDTPPRHLTLIPMKIEEKVLGVIEVASLNMFKNHEIDFLEQVSVSLASTITSTKISEQTANLLEQSKVHAQEMAEQEEEMRQNMEELKATQEESSRREEEFRGIVDAITLSYFLMEFNLDGELVNINEKFVIFLGKEQSELIGKSFHEIVNGKKSAGVTKKFIEEILNGKKPTLVDSVKIKKREYTIQFIFMAILNKDSLPVRVMCLGSEAMN